MFVSVMALYGSLVEGRVLTSNVSTTVVSNGTTSISTSTSRFTSSSQLDFNFTPLTTLSEVAIEESMIEEELQSGVTFGSSVGVIMPLNVTDELESKTNNDTDITNVTNNSSMMEAMNATKGLYASNNANTERTTIITTGPSVTVSVSPSVEASTLPSPGPSVKSSSLPSISIMPSLSLKPSVSKTPSSIPTVSAEPSLSASPSLSHSPSMTQNPSVSPSISPQPSVSPIPTLLPRKRLKTNKAKKTKRGETTSTSSTTGSGAGTGTEKVKKQKKTKGEYDFDDDEIFDPKLTMEEKVERLQGQPLRGWNQLIYYVPDPKEEGQVKKKKEDFFCPRDRSQLFDKKLRKRYHTLCHYNYGDNFTQALITPRSWHFEKAPSVEPSVSHQPSLTMSPSVAPSVTFKPTRTQYPTKTPKDLRCKERQVETKNRERRLDPQPRLYSQKSQKQPRQLEEKGVKTHRPRTFDKQQYNYDDFFFYDDDSRDDDANYFYYYDDDDFPLKPYFWYFLPYCDKLEVPAISPSELEIPANTPVTVGVTPVSPDNAAAATLPPYFELLASTPPTSAPTADPTCWTVTTLSTRHTTNTTTTKFKG